MNYRERLLHYVLRLVAVTKKLGTEKRCGANVATHKQSKSEVIAARCVCEQVAIRSSIIVHVDREPEPAAASRSLLSQRE